MFSHAKVEFRFSFQQRNAIVLVVKGNSVVSVPLPLPSVSMWKSGSDSDRGEKENTLEARNQTQHVWC